MKKDIQIPEVKGVSLLALHEAEEGSDHKLWNIYLLNSGDRAMETIMIVLRGASEDKKTSVMRRSLEKLDPGCFARLEFVPDELVGFHNEYLIAYFQDNTMFEKNYVLEPGSLNIESMVAIPELGTQGIRFE